ncbi:bile acid:sodium symporter family protein [Altererythrobacter sp. ZODW24]|uniref:bile acid:sodium symporter family protein n=1 Tax=Altererythrobacter sp. ZODW24 TaxID=2185142 RepID=UPI000DF7559A|nr:bile acid:sodium symporter family protein [Altererythrobacter sp. ZODW24]
MPGQLLSRIDPMVRLLVAAILLASFLPIRGEAREVAGWISNAAIFVLFFLNGLRLSRTDVLRGMRHMRFLFPLALWCFGAMALAGVGIAAVGAGHLPPLIALGFVFLGTLPSTVQSATAYTSMANGNVANSVVAAATLNITGIFLTAPLFSLLAGVEEVALGLDGLIRIGLVLLLPFVIGQLLQGKLGGAMKDHPIVIRWADRGAIAIAVYVAFSGAVAEGLWSRIDASAWGWLMLAITALLVFGYVGTWLLSGALGLSLPDRIAFLFSGAQKSVAMGAPIATVLFPPAVAGVVLVPLLVYHLAQLVVATPLAKRLAIPPE